MTPQLTAQFMYGFLCGIPTGILLIIVASALVVSGGASRAGR